MKNVKGKKKYIWITIDDNNLIPYCILDCSQQVAAEIERRCVHYEWQWSFIADILHEQYPGWFESYNRYNRRWNNEIIVPYDEGYEILVNEMIKAIKDCFDGGYPEMVDYAEWEVDNQLNSLEVFELE